MRFLRLLFRIYEDNMAVQLNIENLRNFAPHSSILAFTPPSTGSPMDDWCTHLERNPLRRQELEEFAILGDVVVRIADEIEAEPIDKVKILSLEYAVKVLGDETDACEFVRCVKAIASPDAGQFEYQQIAAYYYGEIRRRGIPEVLKEMGLLGMEMAAVTAPVAERELDVTESRPMATKVTKADKRRCYEAARNREPLPAPTPNFDAEVKAVNERIGRQKITRSIYDEFEEYYLSDGNKSLEELDRDFLTFENIEQYDENGIIGLRMSGGQSSVVVFDFEYEVDSSYLPQDARGLGSVIAHLFVGHQMGGSETSLARTLIAESRGYNLDKTFNSGEKFNRLSRPFSDQEFEEWLPLRLEQLYDQKTVRSVRRLRSFGKTSFDYMSESDVNPDYDEMQYVASICRILWYKLHKDFHLRSLRNFAYQEVYMDIRRATDTAVVAEKKKLAFAAFKERNELSLKEFTALNTVAKSQEARLKNHLQPTAKKWLGIIGTASSGQLRYRKFALYNDPEAKEFTRQEKQRLWDAVREREEALKLLVGSQQTRPVQQLLFGRAGYVKVVPAA